MRYVRMAVILSMLVGCATFPRRHDPTRAIPKGWPTPPSCRHINSCFGYRNDPIAKDMRHHDGVDIAAPSGTHVYATAAGRVVYSARNRGGYGNLVRVGHGNGYETWYAHLAKRKVRAGKRVHRGQAIGRVGDTGRTTAPHLHYEIRANGTPIDPEPFLGD